jgi:purine-binding chemotaxis protein CheW
LISSPTTPDDLTDAAARTLLFRVGSTVYGCDIGAVREVVPYSRLTRLPGAPPHVQGLMNLRGTIVTVMDLGVRFDPARPQLRNGSILVAAAGTRLAGIAVEEVMDVRPVVAEEVQEAGSTFDGVVRGMGHSADQVVILIDILSLVKQVLL